MARPDIAARETPATPLLEARSITKSFLGVTALDHVDFVLNRGEIHALLGENGAGKSTLIKILTGAYHGFDGSILLEGKQLLRHQSRKRRRSASARSIRRSIFLKI